MATDDQQVLVTGQANAPATFRIPGNGQIRPKAVFATFDGTGASAAFLPALKVISDGGETVGVYPTSSSVAAGASADVSWFPRLAAAATASTGGVTPVVAYGILAPSTVPNVAAGGTAFVSFGTANTSDATKLAWQSFGGNPNVNVTCIAPAKGFMILMASCTWPAGTKIDCRIASPGGYDILHDGFDGMSGYDPTAVGFGGPQLEDFTMLDFNTAGSVPTRVQLTNSDAVASAPTDVQFACIYFPGVAA